MSLNKLSIVPPVIGHRGACGDAPENTLASFRKAKEEGVRWIEFDVMLTACKEAIVIHDETIDRTTNGQGNVADLTYTQLKTFDAGSWFNPRFARETIPTLDEVLRFFQENNLLPNIEIKPPAGNEEITVSKVLEILKNYPQLKPALLISSFSLDVLTTVRKHDSSIMLGFLMHDWMPDWRQHCEALQCSSVNVNHEILTSTVVKELKTFGVPVTAYTVNDVDRANLLYSWGLDALFTDFPGLILSNSIIKV